MKYANGEVHTLRSGALLDRRQFDKVAVDAAARTLVFAGKIEAERIFHKFQSEAHFVGETHIDMFQLKYQVHVRLRAEDEISLVELGFARTHSRIERQFRMLLSHPSRRAIHR